MITFENVMSNYLQNRKNAGDDLTIQLMIVFELRKINDSLSWLATPIKERYFHED